jgi:hypothetical protein
MQKHSTIVPLAPGTPSFSVSSDPATMETVIRIIKGHGVVGVDVLRLQVLEDTDELAAALAEHVAFLRRIRAMPESLRIMVQK